MKRPWQIDTPRRPWQKESKPFGNTRFDGDFYQSKEWKAFRAYCKNHIPNECKVCGKRGYYLDHIIPISQGGERLSLENVQYLCPRCHTAKTNRERKQNNK